MKTPDVTPVQWKAAGAALVSLLVALGIQLTTNNAQLLEGIIGTAGPLFAGLWMAADAHIRHGRAVSPNLHATTETTTTVHADTGDTSTTVIAPTPAK
jgi:hypothetical protein